ncbi:MAG TPA: HAMP domain-containing sensor histidine kinase [Flavisolibacter sp.]
MSRPLLQKNTRYLLTWLPIVLLLGSLVFYFVLQMHAHHMQEKQLMLKQRNIWTAFTLQPATLPKYIQGEYDIKTVQATSLSVEPRDTTIYFNNTKEKLPFQVATAFYNWQGQTYQLSTYVSSREIHHLIIKIFITEAVIFALILLTIVIVNKKSSFRLWKPFFSTIQKVKQYDITRTPDLNLPLLTGTKEFDELNKEVTTLIDNVNRAYIQQKHFVENASHEMQTPLAIIRSKLELLINQEGLTEKRASLLSDISEANDHLSRMNRTLLLLAKIENNQFPETETVDVSGILMQLVSDYRNYYNGEFPSLTENVTSILTVKANRSLIEILLSNLLKNAIEHNQENGFIDITVTDSRMVIKNSGAPPEKDTKELFDRFAKGSHQNRTTGLGLSLVKQICLLYNYRVNYGYANGLHEVTIDFSGRL